MLKKNLMLVLAITLLWSVSSAYAQRGPATPDERKRVVEMVTFLESTPLAKEAKDYRKTLLFFLVEVPDITVVVCSDVLGESKRIKGDYESEIFSQLMYSQAKFVIENPAKAQDHAALHLAAVEGVLRTWQAIKAEKPKAKFPLLDELLQKQQAGALADYVKEGMKSCQKKS